MSDESRDFKVYRWRDLLYSSDLPSNAKYLGAYIHKFTHDQQTVAWPSQETIRRETNLSNGTINKYLKVLEQNQWIVRISGNSKKSTRYFLFLPLDARNQMDLPESYYDKDSKYYLGNLLAKTESRHSDKRSMKTTPHVDLTLHESETNKSIKIKPVINKPVINKKKNIKKKKKDTNWKPPDWINLEAWREFEQHRQEVKKPLTDLARSKTAKQLEGLSFDHQQQTVDKSIRSGWIGLFPDKGKTNETRYRPSKQATQSDYSGFETDEGFLAEID